MHLPARVAVTIGSFALVLGGSMTAAHAQSVGSDVVGHLYVNDNTASMNNHAMLASLLLQTRQQRAWHRLRNLVKA